MALRSTWMVRAGEGGSYLDEFLADKVAAIGWRDAGRIEPTTSDEDVQKAFAAAFPDWKEGSRRSGAAQVKRFLRELEPGDGVATYDRDRRIYILGTIAGPPEWQPDRELSRRRPVKWTNQVSRDLLSATARNTLGSTLALFRIDEEIAAELLAKATPYGGSRTEGSLEPAVGRLGPVDPAGESEVIADAETKAQSFVEDRLVVSPFVWKLKMAHSPG
jgi:restriction system protein